MDWTVFIMFLFVWSENGPTNCVRSKYNFIVQVVSFIFREKHQCSVSQDNTAGVITFNECHSELNLTSPGAGCGSLIKSLSCNLSSPP